MIRALLITIPVFLMFAAPAAGVPAGAWVGTWQVGSSPTFDVTGSDSSLTIVSPCPGGENPTGVRSTGHVTSADFTVSEWEYTGKPDCPGVGGKYTATMTADCMTVTENGVTQFGSPVRDTWRRVSPVPAACAASCDSSSRAHAAAINEVRVVACSDGCEYRSGSGEFQAVQRDTILRQGHELSCDPDGSVTLAFSDNSTVVVRNTTQLKIGSFFTEGGVVRTELLLKMGEISAKVNKSETTRSDFKIKPPSGSGSVRGTAFSVFADPVAKVTIWKVTEGVVRVTAGGRKVDVTAGRKVEVAGSTIRRPVVRGGRDRQAARDAVLAVLAGSSCQATLPSGRAVTLKPVKAAWAVAVPLTGAVKGTARWRVPAKGPRATNALARQVAGGCSG